ncbi:MAG: hydrolase, partial [Clostridia bacterium]|nr:hydrolase [Clostridia bacterium]
MNIQENIARFEAELAKVNRPGMDKLLAYIRKSDFYKAPASTKYHLCCEGGLLQHSLNVLDALRGILTLAMDCTETTEPCHYEYRAAGKTVATIPQDSVII